MTNPIFWLQAAGVFLALVVAGAAVFAVFAAESEAGVPQITFTEGLLIAFALVCLFLWFTQQGE